MSSKQVPVLSVYSDASLTNSQNVFTLIHKAAVNAPRTRSKCLGFTSTLSPLFHAKPPRHKHVAFLCCLGRGGKPAMYAISYIQTLACSHTLAKSTSGSLLSQLLKNRHRALWLFPSKSPHGEKERRYGSVTKSGERQAVSVKRKRRRATAVTTSTRCINKTKSNSSHLVSLCGSVVQSRAVEPDSTCAQRKIHSQPTSESWLHITQTTGNIDNQQRETRTWLDPGVCSYHLIGALSLKKKTLFLQSTEN